MMSFNYIDNRNSFQKLDILDREGGDIMTTIQKLSYITEDIRRSYYIPQLYSRVEVVYDIEIKAIIKKLDLIKSLIDIEYKLNDAPIDVQNFRKHVVSLMCDTQDLYVNVLNKNDELIKKYNSYIVDTLRYLAI